MVFGNPQELLNCLSDYLSYDANSGDFIWFNSPTSSIKPGSYAGTYDDKGYLYIAFKKRKYAAGRLAYLYTKGLWPNGVIDHIDGNPSNNALYNLRDVTQTVNLENQTRARNNNKLGLLGVSRDKKRFRARIVVNGKQKYIGIFDTPEEAHIAYIEEKRLVHKGNTL